MPYYQVDLVFTEYATHTNGEYDGGVIEMQILDFFQTSSRDELFELIINKYSEEINESDEWDYDVTPISKETFYHETSGE